MLELIKVNKSFEDGDRFKVLKNINLSAKKGGFVCVIGPSGCGKTILLYLIAGFLKPTSGRITLEGKPITGPSTDRAMVFQNYILFPWKTVFGNVLFGLENTRISNRQKEDLVKQCLKLVDLSKFKDWHVHKLSGGMQQRVALARALIMNPKILLMDEPFAALDAQYRRFLRKNLVEIWQKTKKTIIFVTHSINEAIYLADKIYLFSARPTKVNKVYQVNLPRPRDERNREFLKLSHEIESYTSKEFEKTIKDKLPDKPIESLLKIDF